MGDKVVKIESHRQEENGYLFEPPSICIGCERELRVKEIREGSIGPYIKIMLPVPGLCIYQCTRCQTIMGNIHAVRNLKILQAIEEEESNIILPTSNLIRPH